MVILALACVLTGMAVGLRFKVFAIIPIIAAAAILSVAVAPGAGLGIVAAMVLNIVAVQVGYLCGTFANGLLREQRTPASAVVSSAPSAKAYNSQKGVGIPAQ